MQVERIIVNFNPVFGLRNRRRGLKRFSCFSRKRTDLSKKKLHGVCTLTKVYQYAKEERFLFFEPCRTLVDICMELLLKWEEKLPGDDFVTWSFMCRIASSDCCGGSGGGGRILTNFSVKSLNSQNKSVTFAKQTQ